MIDARDVSIARQCALLSVNRSTYYYKTCQARDDTQIMNTISELHHQFPYYGYRRLTVLLNEMGHAINQKRTARLMQKMAIKAFYPAPRTSLPGVEQEVYPYLLKGVAIVRPNQVWGIDITYIRLPVGMVYLFALIDWYSRYVVGWTVSITMETCHALSAFNQGLQLATPEITNMDQGSQFTGKEWVAHLKAYNVLLSHTGIGRCLDNVFIERFWRSVKWEDIYLQQYTTVPQAREGIGHYIMHYNTHRPHQALNYARPADLYFTHKT